MNTVLQLDGITVRFGGLAALTDVDLELHAGEVLGLIGPNGAGKTTLLNVVAGVFRPTAGQIDFCGTNITALSADERCRRGIVKTFQLTRPFARLSVEENVAIGAFLRHRTRRKAMSTADEWIGVMGLRSHARRAAGSLSTADRKRLEVARALATEPKIVLLDEVFSGLNAMEIEGSLAWVERIASFGIAVILTEHLLRPITALAQRTIVLDRGRKICDAPTALALREPQVIQAYFGAEESTRA